MARERLSWDKKKEAEQKKQADPYTMNQDHTNPPASKYDIGGPSEFAEDPDMKTPWKNEGRVETGHPAPAREAVKAARQLEDKALKCITIAQRILPGASDNIIEDQATDFMHLPDKCILATLQRQAELAEKLAKDDEKDEEKMEEEKEAKEEKVVEEKPAEKEAAKEKEEPEEEEEKEAKEEKVAEEKPAEKEAAKEKEEPEEEEEEKEAKEEPKKEATAEMDIELGGDNSVDLLDSVFAAEEKQGAKKLSGIVKQASSEGELGSLWTSPPDVSEAFK